MYDQIALFLSVKTAVIYRKDNKYISVGFKGIFLKAFREDIFKVLLGESWSMTKDGIFERVSFFCLIYYEK